MEMHDGFFEVTEGEMAIRAACQCSLNCCCCRAILFLS